MIRFYQLIHDNEVIVPTQNEIIQSSIYCSLPLDVKDFVKLYCLRSIGTGTPLIRATLGILIATIAAKGNICSWPELLPTLISALDSGNEELIDGTLSTLQKVCEDIPEQLESESIQRPLLILIPKFIEFFKYPSTKVRSHAITCINQFILCRSSALLQHMKEFLEGLFSLADDKVNNNLAHFIFLLDIVVTSNA
ncbi:Transportin-1-like [Oopsacas minuta]|uniref:Transportin-1-like n=1 Tax=Oopsacas minuta TaxID=111878 RepID=A0AAV7JJT9_9METZ|nr:Transportin-1-like [Oopsacas minuta]